MPLLAIALGQALDFATTYRGLSMGGVELNATMARVIDASWYLFLAWKMGAALATLPVMGLMRQAKMDKRSRARWLWLCAAVTWFPVVGNIYQMWRFG